MEDLSTILNQFAGMEVAFHERSRDIWQEVAEQLPEPPARPSPGVHATECDACVIAKSKCAQQACTAVRHPAHHIVLGMDQISRCALSSIASCAVLLREERAHMS